MRLWMPELRATRAPYEPAPPGVTRVPAETVELSGHVETADPAEEALRAGHARERAAVHATKAHEACMRAVRAACRAEGYALGAIGLCVASVVALGVAVVVSLRVAGVG
jgi:hypothetical protein